MVNLNSILKWLVGFGTMFLPSSKFPFESVVNPSDKWSVRIWPLFNSEENLIQHEFSSYIFLHHCIVLLLCLCFYKTLDSHIAPSTIDRTFCFSDNKGDNSANKISHLHPQRGLLGKFIICWWKYSFLVNKLKSVPFVLSKHL